MKRHIIGEESVMSITSGIGLKATRLSFTTEHGETVIEIDESLYSRQLYVLGHDSMKRMSMSNVLISGLNGLGAEIAKNVILSGVKRVVLHDTQPVTLADLSTQFYLDEADVGKNRALACHTKFAELNSYVAVESSNEELTPELLFDFQVVVLCNYLPHDEILRITEFCHEANIKVIVASTRGLFGQIFCDFGDRFHVSDTDGEEPLQCMIESITYDKDNGIVTLTESGSHGFRAGDSILFRDVRGATGLNSCGPVIIKSIISPFVFSIGDTTGYGHYEGGGVVVQAKSSITLSFKSFQKSLRSPEFVVSDFAKMDRQPNLHLAFCCLSRFADLHHGDLPQPRNLKQAKQFVDICKQEKVKLGCSSSLDEQILEEFASQCAGNLCPMNAVIGGIAAQEVIKSVSGKFTPLKQWFYFDALECLPLDMRFLTEKECSPTMSRYDAEIAIFGRHFIDKLAKQNIFLVGAGALGCEMIKNMAMMGVGTKGHVTITDMDLIERSNLNRQFLFRKSDLQQPKADRAAAAGMKMNPEMKMVAHRNRVGPETEDVYDDDFYLDTDVVINALDNVEARKYMDERCVHFSRPMLESGTLGTKGNVQVILPELTESYSSSNDPPERSYPICTIKNFPYAIEHTIQWAREVFDGCFKASMFHVLQYVQNANFEASLKGFSDSHARSILKTLKQLLVTERPETFEDCVKWARLLWQDNFYNQTKQMLHSFPPDAVTSEGVNFWSGSKRLPRLIEFSTDNPWHLDFVSAAANLRAEMFGLGQQVRDKKAILKMISDVKISNFQPRNNVKIDHMDDDDEDGAVADASDISFVTSENGDDHQPIRSVEELIKQLPTRESLLKSHFQAIEFEKDDDTNFHLDFIVAASNSRAEIYDIPTVDRHKTKRIAGRIIPAIATTTSVVVGLVCLELVKIVQGHSDLSRFKNGFINLALPLFAFSEPLAPKSFMFNGNKCTLWDRIVMEGEPTLGELIETFKSKHKLSVTMLSCGVVILYSDFMPGEKKQQRLTMRIPAILEVVTGKKLNPKQRIMALEICCEDENGNDIEDVPTIHYFLGETSQKCVTNGFY